jgi:hypothetical protein
LQVPFWLSTLVHQVNEAVEYAKLLAQAPNFRNNPAVDVFGLALRRRVLVEGFYLESENTKLRMTYAPFQASRLCNLEERHALTEPRPAVLRP